MLVRGVRVSEVRSRKGGRVKGRIEEGSRHWISDTGRVTTWMNRQWKSFRSACTMFRSVSESSPRYDGFWSVGDEIRDHVRRVQVGDRRRQSGGDIEGTIEKEVQYTIEDVRSVVVSRRRYIGFSSVGDPIRSHVRRVKAGDGGCQPG